MISHPFTRVHCALSNPRRTLHILYARFVFKSKLKMYLTKRPLKEKIILTRYRFAAALSAEAIPMLPPTSGKRSKELLYNCDWALAIDGCCQI